MGESVQINLFHHIAGDAAFYHDIIVHLLTHCAAAMLTCNCFTSPYSPLIPDPNHYLCRGYIINF